MEWLWCDEFAAWGIRQKEFAEINDSLRRIDSHRWNGQKTLWYSAKARTSVDGALGYYPVRIRLGNLKTKLQSIWVTKGAFCFCIGNWSGYISINDVIESYESPWVKNYHLGFNRENTTRSKQAGQCIVTSATTQLASKALTGVGRWCNDMLDSGSEVGQGIDSTNSVKCWESSDLLTRRQNHINRAELCL